MLLLHEVPASRQTPFLATVLPYALPYPVTFLGQLF